LRSLTLLFLFFSLHSVASQPVVWGTDSWNNFTNVNGTGFYHELINSIYDKAHYDVSVEYLSFARSLRALHEGSIDLTGALPKTDDFYQSARPILSEHIYMVVNGENPPFCCDTTNKVGAYRSGYKEEVFYAALPHEARGVEVASAEDGLKLLSAGKVDYVVDVQSMLLPLLANPNYGSMSMHSVGYYDLYWSFARTEKGRELKTQFDVKLEQLRESGELSTLYKKYQLTMPHE
jgi:polar amino acid transport system substrate-binding protein